MHLDVAAMRNQSQNTTLRNIKNNPKWKTHGQSAKIPPSASRKSENSSTSGKAAKKEVI
jgi:hypothetical protein